MPLETIDITLSSVNYHEIGKFSKSGNKYLIARTTTGLTIKGEMEKPIPGERYRLWGETRKQKPWKNRPAEDAFEFTDSEPIIDQSEAGVANYLRNYVDKLGIVKAQAIVEHFGVETLLVLRTMPERALEVHGITDAVVDAIREHFDKHVTLDPVAYAKLIDMFSGHKVPTKIIKTLLKDFGSDAPRKIKENPYILLAFPRMGWKTVDSIATSVCEYPADGVERHKWAIVEGLERISSQGHTYASQVDIEKEVFGFLGSRPIADAWGAAEADDLVVPVEDDCYALPKIAEAENTIARCLATLMEAGNPLPFSLPDEGLLEGQRDALRLIEANPVVILCGAPGTGKAQPLSAGILTPWGWTLMGKLQVGDHIINSKGGASRVTGIFPQGNKPVYRVNFTDGASTECCGEHLWLVQSRQDRKARNPKPGSVKSLNQIMEEMARKADRDHYFPMVEPIQFDSRIPLPLDPYLLGVLLGDGCFRGGYPGLSNPEPYIQEYVRAHLPEGHLLVPSDRKPNLDFRIIRPDGNRGNRNQLVVILEKLGLWGCMSTDKFIPTDYLFANQTSRMDLLAGLLDTDGYCGGHNIEFATSSEELAQCVQHLVQTLGGKSKINSRIPIYTYKGERRVSFRSYRMNIILPPSIKPFRLPRKANAYIPKTKYHPVRMIESIEKIGHKFVQCISVDAPDQLYVTDGCILTHNTYTITRALTGLVSQGFQAIRFATPTGKAAKRAEELLTKALPNSGIVPSTIHRLLQPTPSLEPGGVPRESAKMGRGREEFGFGRNEDNPIDAQLLVVDEASMLDVLLGASLLKSIAPGTRVIFVGDPNQLPSVGPGSVLRDMIAAGVPTATLTEIQRNSGRIVKACHAILGGDVPAPAPKVDIPAGENWIHVELSEPAEINKRIVALHESARKNGKFDPEWDMQVISPEKKKAGVGCDDLNRALSDLLNPFKSYNPEKVAEDDSGRPPAFEVGDKVLRDKNGLADRMLTQAEINELGLDSEGAFTWEGTRYGLVETDVVNGDMGTVRAIVKNADNWYVIVQFNNPYRLCRLPYGDSHLIPAYAVTCHKAQGSGFPYVIVPCHSSFYMWNREMIYTLFSRSERLLVTVGQYASIRTGIGRKTVDHRNTRLESLLLPLFAPQGVELSHA